MTFTQNQSDKNTSWLRFTGKIREMPTATRALLQERMLSPDPIVRERTARIIARVKQEGDSALLAMAREFDGVQLHTLEVPREEWRASLARLDKPLRSALERAAKNIECAHIAFRPRAVEVETEPGVIVGRRPDALRRAGVYAPGGRAAYPSSVLMGVIPARVAGVQEVVVCSPPTATCLPPDVVLAAAELGGADRLFAVGGAGAIAAMAYGSHTIPRVDLIVGPGNAYVAEAKLQVNGVIATDAPAGPSELLVIADSSANPELVAREMLAQAEHDPSASVITLAVGDSTATKVLEALAQRLPLMKRREVAAEALSTRGGVLTATSHDEAVVFANEYAAEHLLLATSDKAEQNSMLAKLRNCGAVFLGETSSVVFGDYMTGANHVLPTGGLARFHSGLSTQDFVRWTSYQRVSAQAAREMSEHVCTLASSEGLPAHADAAKWWAITGVPA